MQKNMKQNQRRFGDGVKPYWRAMSAPPPPRDAIILGKDERDKLKYLPLELLKTHLMIQAPTGAGKTFLARHLFRLLAKQNAAIFVDDPKGDLFAALEEDCAALNLHNRTVLFSTSRRDRLLAFNPLKSNGLDVADYTLWTLGGIKASWGQESFDQTPQLARWLYNAVALVIEGEGTFLDALELLHFEKTETRTSFVARTKNELLRQEWEAYASLPVSRRREETASAYARLRPFCHNPTVKTIVAQKERSIDLGEMLTAGRILLSCIPRYRPLDPELVNLLRSFLLQSLLAQALHHPLGERPPLYLILDEAEHALARDTGIIETILNEGRSLGIHLILIFHNFAQVAKKNPGLVASVITNCRTKVIGGHLSQDDLDILTPEFFITEWNTHIIKDEIWTPDRKPVETTRTQKSRSRGESESEGYQSSIAYGVALSKGLTQSRAVTDGSARTDSYSFSDTSGHSETTGSGSSKTNTTGSSTSGDDRGATVKGSSKSRSVTDSYNHSATDSNSGTSSRGSSTSVMQAITNGVARTLTATQSKSESQGRSVSKGRNWSEGETIVPFYEYEEHWRVSSREFLRLDEFLAEKLIALKSQRTGHWAIKPPQGKAVFFRAVLVKSLLQAEAALNEFRESVYSGPCYVAPAETESEEAPPYTEPPTSVECEEEDFEA